MASVLDFERYSADLGRELLRRIGYTNGLHKLRRFARVVEYLYGIMPTSAKQLAQVTIREENQRAESKDTLLTGADYALGIVDVAKALLLVDRFGPKLALSSQGYACHALTQTASRENLTDIFLFEKVIEADGEYTLNILRLIDEGISETNVLGETLMKRFLALIEYKKQWAETHINHRFSQRSLVLMLSDAFRTLDKAISKKASLVEFFYKHTVNPRLEWLHDLGCLRTETGRGTICTESGRRVLAEIKRLGGWTDTFIFLPLDRWLATQLDIPSLYPEDGDRDFVWRLVASATADVRPQIGFIGDRAALLVEIKLIYPFVKLANFNEADALSIYEVLATRYAHKGFVLPQADFEQSLVELVREFSAEIFKLSKRRGKGLYIALKKLV